MVRILSAIRPDEWYFYAKVARNNSSVGEVLFEVVYSLENFRKRKIDLRYDQAKLFIVFIISMSKKD